MIRLQGLIEGFSAKGSEFGELQERIIKADLSR